MKIHEWLVPAGAARNLTPEEIEASRTADPEMTLISDYLCKALDDAQMREVEWRLREDEGFRERVVPVVTAWNAWPTVRDFEVSDAEIEASWQGVLQKLAARDARDDGDDEDDSDADYDDDAAREVDEAAFVRRLRRWQLAAGLIAVVGLPASFWLSFTYAQRTAPPQVHMADVSTRESQVVRVSNDSWAVVGAGSRLTWRDDANENGVRELLLDGEARFGMTKVPAGHYVVVTPSARVIVTGTEFTVDATDPTVTVVSVTEGKVVLSSRGMGPAEIVTLGPGERGRAIFGQAARRMP